MVFKIRNTENVYGENPTAVPEKTTLASSLRLRLDIVHERTNTRPCVHSTHTYKHVQVNTYALFEGEKKANENMRYILLSPKDVSVRTHRCPTFFAPATQQRHGPDVLRQLPREDVSLASALGCILSRF